MVGLTPCVSEISHGLKCSAKIAGTRKRNSERLFFSLASFFSLQLVVSSEKIGEKNPRKFKTKHIPKAFYFLV